jgi:hypothetical protein
MAMVSLSAELRRMAEQVRSKAERIDASKVRAEMLEIAARFELLAKRAEKLARDRALPEWQAHAARLRSLAALTAYSGDYWRISLRAKGLVLAVRRGAESARPLGIGN